MGLPFGRRGLDPLQLLEDGEQTGPALGAGGRRGVLPAGQKAHEVADGDRIDQAPATLTAGPVQADQKVSGAPTAIGERDGRALRFETGQRRARPRRRDRCAHGRAGGQGRIGREVGHGDRAGQLEMTADTGRGGLVVVAQGRRGLPLLGGHPAAVESRWHGRR